MQSGTIVWDIATVTTGEIDTLDGEEYSQPDDSSSEIYATSMQAANNNSWNVVKNFVSNFVSLRFYVQELKNGGCLNTFAHATASALNPLSLGLATDGATVTMFASAAMRKNAALEYAASRPTVIDVAKSTTYNNILRGGTQRGAAAARASQLGEGALGYIDAALFQGLLTEGAAAYNGECR